MSHGGPGAPAGVPSAARDTPVLPHHRKLSDARVAMNGRNALEVSPDAPGYIPDAQRLVRVDAAAVVAAERAAAAAKTRAVEERKRASGGAEPPPWAKEDSVTQYHAGAPLPRGAAGLLLLLLLLLRCAAL
jgi:hypothetical protein